MTVDEEALNRQKLAHLSRDWNALAARLERENYADDDQTATETRVLRQCARQLREILGG